MAHGTDGELITYDANGAPATVAVGTATHVLTSNGAGNAPTFQEAGGGGGVTYNQASTTRFMNKSGYSNNNALSGRNWIFTTNARSFPVSIRQHGGDSELHSSADVRAAIYSDWLQSSTSTYPSVTYTPYWIIRGWDGGTQCYTRSKKFTVGWEYLT